MKEKMTVQLKNYFPPSDGQYGTSQGSYVTTPKGEFKCYNNGPTWFTDADKGQNIDIVAEWKQNKASQEWYLSCSYGQAVAAPQGPPQTAQQSPPQGQTSPQNRTQAPPAYTPPSQVPPPAVDPEKKPRGMCRFGFYNTLIGSIGAAGLLANPAELAAVEVLIEYSMNGCKEQPKPFNQFAKEADKQDNLPPTDYPQTADDRPIDDGIPF